MKYILLLLIFTISLSANDRPSSLLKDNDLQLYYTFEELHKRQVKDESAESNHSTVFNGAIRDNGIFGKYCDLSNNGSIDLDDFRISTNFTMSLWVNIKSLRNGQCFIGKHKDNGDNIFLFGIWAEGYHVRIRDTRYEAGKPYEGWQHLVLTGEAHGGVTDLNLYHNGKEVWAATLKSTLGNTIGKPWTIGQEWDGQKRGDFLNGDIDEVATFKRALNKNEVASLYNSYAQKTSIKLKSASSAKTHNGSLTDFLNPENKLFEISSDDFEKKWRKKFGAKWTDKIRSSARSTEKIPFKDSYSRETIFKFRNKKLSQLTMVFYNKGDHQNLRETKFKEYLKFVVNNCSQYFGAKPKFKPNAGITKNYLYYWLKVPTFIS